MIPIIQAYIYYACACYHETYQLCIENDEDMVQQLNEPNTASCYVHTIELRQDFPQFHEMNQSIGSKKR